MATTSRTKHTMKADDILLSSWLNFRKAPQSLYCVFEEKCQLKIHGFLIHWSAFCTDPFGMRPYRHLSNRNRLVRDKVNFWLNQIPLNPIVCSIRSQCADWWGKCGYKTNPWGIQKLGWFYAWQFYGGDAYNTGAIRASLPGRKATGAGRESISVSSGALSAG